MDPRAGSPGTACAPARPPRCPRPPHRIARRLAAFATGLAVVANAQALDLSGYLRAGPGGSTQAGAARACYALPGPGLKYRLGNECDFYGEIQASQDLRTPASTDDAGALPPGLDTRVSLMLNQWTPATEPDGPVRVAQFWVESRGWWPALPQVVAWAGKERGRRGDVYIVDTFFVEMAGVGAGLRSLPVGPGKAGAAVYATDTDAARPGVRLNAELVDLPAGAGGDLQLHATLTRGRFEGGTRGAALSLRHQQEDVGGSGLQHRLWLQWARGSAGLNQNFDDLARSPRAGGWRIVETLAGQAGRWGTQGMLLLARDDDAAGNPVRMASAGARAAWTLAPHAKLVGEAGVSWRHPEGGDGARLAKFTFAATLAAGDDFFSRPEFRLYITQARWNRAAGNPTGEAAFDGATAGTSYGAQVELWF
jgi:maltoporin